MTIAALDRLAQQFGDRWIAGAARRDHYRPLEGHHRADRPARVVQPRSIAEVQDIVRHAAAAGISIVPYGAGTSLEGNAASGADQLCLDLSLMNQVLELRSEDLLVVVEPGVTREQLNQELRATGLCFPIDPGANATLGGMVSTRASGTTAVRYGTMRENVLALKVVMPDGTLIETGCRARKSAAGYDLTHLFVGSEGTLGIVVEATLRLHGIPDTVLSGTWPFDTLRGAVDTVIGAIQCGLPVARLELLDPAAIAACNAFSGLTLPTLPTLFVELHGDQASILAQHELLAAIGAEHGGRSLNLSTDLDEQRRLWRARHEALPAARNLIAGAQTWVTDICVPISQLAAAIEGAHQGIAQAGLTAPILGHVGDGNYHVFFVLHPDDADGWAAAAAVNRQMIDFALSVGGTCTGEHGIGLGKREALVREHGEPSVAVMQKIKQALDPDNRFNPGKIFLPG